MMSLYEKINDAALVRAGLSLRRSAGSGTRETADKRLRDVHTTPDTYIGSPPQSESFQCHLYVLR